MVVVKAQPLQRALNAALPQGVQFQRETKLHLPAEINLVLLTGLFGFVGDFFSVLGWKNIIYLSPGERKI